MTKQSPFPGHFPQEGTPAQLCTLAARVSRSRLLRPPGGAVRLRMGRAGVAGPGGPGGGGAAGGGALAAGCVTLGLTCLEMS
jgi:hypothetical protein